MVAANLAVHTELCVDVDLMQHKRTTASELQLRRQQFQF